MLQRMEQDRRGDVVGQVADQAQAAAIGTAGYTAALSLLAMETAGLTPERGRAALEAGADVVSAVTDITLNPDPEGRMRAWLAATEAAGASRPRTPAGYLDKEEGAER